MTSCVLQKCCETTLRLLQLLDPALSSSTAGDFESTAAVDAAPSNDVTRQLYIMPCHERHVFPRCVDLLVACLQVREVQ